MHPCCSLFHGAWSNREACSMWPCVLATCLPCPVPGSLTAAQLSFMLLEAAHKRSDRMYRNSLHSRMRGSKGIYGHALIVHAALV